MRVRLSVDVDRELKRRLKVTAALRSLSVKELVEQALEHELKEPGADEAARDRAWLGADLAGLGAFEPYSWGPGELDEGQAPEGNAHGD